MRFVAKNSGIGLLAQLVIKVASFGFSIWVVRNLGADAFGQYAAVLAFGALFVFLGDLGLSAYSVREVARLRNESDGEARIRELYGSVVLLRLVLSAVGALLIITAALLTGREPGIVVAIALGTLGLMLYAFQGTCEAVLAGFERLDVSAKAKVVNQLAFVIIGAVALCLGAGYYGLIVANLLSIALLTWVCWRAVGSLGIQPARAVVRQWPVLLRAAVPIGIGGFAIGASYNFDSVLLNVYRSNAETAYYAAVYNLIFSVCVLSNVVNAALFPTLVRRMAVAPDDVPGICSQMLRYLLVLALPISTGGLVVAHQLVPLLFSSGFVAAIPVLQILICVVPLMFLSEFLGYLVFANGLERVSARAILISTGFNIAANLILIPRYGLYAASVITVCTEVVLVAQYLWILRSIVHTLDWNRAFLRPFGAALLMLFVPLLLGRLGAPVLVVIPIAAAAYSVILVAFRVVGSAELAFIRSLLRMKSTSSKQVTHALDLVESV